MSDKQSEADTTHNTDDEARENGSENSQLEPNDSQTNKPAEESFGKDIDEIDPEDEATTSREIEGKIEQKQTEEKVDEASHEISNEEHDALSEPDTDYQQDKDELVLEDINLPGDEYDDEDEAVQDSGKKKWVLLGMSVLLVAGIAGGGVFYFTNIANNTNIGSSKAVVSFDIPSKSKLKKGRKKLLSSSKKLATKTSSNNPGKTPKLKKNIATKVAKMEGNPKKQLLSSNKKIKKEKKISNSPDGKKTKRVKEKVEKELIKVNEISKAVKPKLKQATSGAKRLADGSLSLPSVTAAAYKGIPMMKNPRPLADPDKSLGESIGGGIIPKIASDGRRPWKFYGKTFKNIEGLPRISLIIQGLGLSKAATTAAINHTPSEVTLAFNPYAKGVGNWVALARAVGHETLISLPMEPLEFPTSDPGPFALQVDLQQTENIDRLRYILSVSMGNVGLLQMMGTRFASSSKSLEPILKEISSRGLLIVDNGLVKSSQIIKIASNIGLPRVQNNIHIDREPSRRFIISALSQLEKIAKRNKSSVGIAQPLPNTISLIMTWTKTLAAKNIVLAPISANVKISGKVKLATSTPESEKDK